MLLIGAAALVGCSASESESASLRDPTRMDARSAELDAWEALGKNDRHLLGTGEMGDASVPAAPDGWREAEWPHGVLTIMNTRTMRDHEDLRYRDQARAYAAAYNRIVLAEVAKADPEPPPGEPKQPTFIRVPSDVRMPCAAEVRIHERDLDPRKATRQARTAFASGDHFLLGAWGHGIGFPEASPADAERLGCLAIADTSHHAEGYFSYDAAARFYAGIWNTEMLRLTATAPRTSPRPRSPG